MACENSWNFIDYNKDYQNIYVFLPFEEESAFVAIQCEYSEITDGGNRVCYGFIEMSLDGAGDPIVLSAYREDEVNQGLYIFGSGPTPEPTSAMLVLFGFAALALRRRT